MVERPWAELKQNRLVHDRQVLIIARSYYEAKIEAINREVDTLTEIIAGQTTFNPDYGKTDSPIDYVPEAPRISIKGLIRGFRSKL